jgi:hypothetical protein
MKGQTSTELWHEGDERNGRHPTPERCPAPTLLRRRPRQTPASPKKMPGPHEVTI